MSMALPLKDSQRAAGSPNQRLHRPTLGNGDIFYARPAPAARPVDFFGSGTAPPPMSRSPAEAQPGCPRWFAAKGGYSLHRRSEVSRSRSPETRGDDRADYHRSLQFWGIAPGINETVRRSSSPQAAYRCVSADSSLLNIGERVSRSKSCDRLAAMRSLHHLGIGLSVEVLTTRGAGSCSPTRGTGHDPALRRMAHNQDCLLKGGYDIGLADRMAVGSCSPARDEDPRSPAIGSIASPARRKDGPAQFSNLMKTESQYCKRPTGSKSSPGLGRLLPPKITACEYPDPRDVKAQMDDELRRRRPRLSIHARRSAEVGRLNRADQRRSLGRPVCPGTPDHQQSYRAMEKVKKNRPCEIHFDAGQEEHYGNSVSTGPPVDSPVSSVSSPHPGNGRRLPFDGGDSCSSGRTNQDWASSRSGAAQSSPASRIMKELELEAPCHPVSRIWKELEGDFGFSQEDHDKEEDSAAKDELQRVECGDDVLQLRDTANHLHDKVLELQRMADSSRQQAKERLGGALERWEADLQKPTYDPPVDVRTLAEAALFDGQWTTRTGQEVSIVGREVTFSDGVRTLELQSKYEGGKLCWDDGDVWTRKVRASLAASPSPIQSVRPTVLATSVQTRAQTAQPVANVSPCAAAPAVSAPAKPPPVYIYSAAHAQPNLRQPLLVRASCPAVPGSMNRIPAPPAVVRMISHDRMNRSPSPPVVVRMISHDQLSGSQSVVHNFPACRISMV